MVAPRFTPAATTPCPRIVAIDPGSERSAVVVYDVADYPGLHPLLAPFVMKVPLQWMVVHSALLRGILDLDDRVFMGRNVLSKGGARWP